MWRHVLLLEDVQLSELLLELLLLLLLVLLGFLGFETDCDGWWLDGCVCGVALGVSTSANAGDWEGVGLRFHGVFA